MQRVARKQQSLRKGGSPAGLDEVEIARLVRAVDLVADDGVSAVCEVDADLVHPSRRRKCAHERKLRTALVKTPLDAEPRERRRAVGMHTLLQVDRRWTDVALSQQ